MKHTKISKNLFLKITIGILSLIASHQIQVDAAELQQQSLLQIDSLSNSLSACKDELSNFRKNFEEMQNGFSQEVCQSFWFNTPVHFSKKIDLLKMERDRLQNELADLTAKTIVEQQCQTDVEGQQSSTLEEQIADLFEQHMQLKAELNEKETELHRLREEKLLSSSTIQPTVEVNAQNYLKLINFATLKYQTGGVVRKKKFWLSRSHISFFCQTFLNQWF